MSVYIALLRGINVGGKNKIKMADLKRMFESIGFSRIETYIQSGNVLFESNEEESTLQKKIEDAIEKTFGFSILVVLRTAEALKRILLDCPFSEDEINAAELSNIEGESLYVAMLSNVPVKEKIEFLNVFKSDDDDYRILGSNIYLLLRKSIRNSKLANHLQKVDASVTVRNFKTMKKLYELVNSELYSN